MSDYDLSKNVKVLNELWMGYFQEKTYLKSVEISSEIALKGICGSRLDFTFPITVLCGTNGTGKTTFSTLSLLAFHGENPKTLLKKGNYFDFQYFFCCSSSEKHKKGIQISWTYTNIKRPLRIKKGKERWMRYLKNDGNPRRPIKGTEFIGISRIIPPFEKKRYNSYFSKRTKKSSYSQKLNEYMSYILERGYENLSLLEHHNSSEVHRINDYGLYSSFNAGAGEECLTNILSTLLDVANESFIVIEEIEIGIHPSCLKRLIQVIFKIASDKKLQMVITTHSPTFLRACPKEALVFAERNDNRVFFTKNPNVEYAISCIAGKESLQRTLFLVCEDDVAAGLIREVLPPKIKNLLIAKGYGGKEELIKNAQTLRTADSSKKILIIWDGDARSETHYAEGAKKESFPFDYFPTDKSPEKYIIEKLDTEEGKGFLKEFVDDNEVFSLIQKIKSDKNPHNVFHSICEKCDENEDDVKRKVICFVSKNNKEDFSDIIRKIEEILS